MKLYVRIEGNRLYKPVEDSREFLHKWERAYPRDDVLEEKYRKNIGWGETKLKPEQLKGLWEWKSPQWSGRFQDRYQSQLDAFNAFREAEKPDMKTFWEEVAQSISRTGFIYQAFAFHIGRPQEYPIVDHHVLRAYTCLSSDPLRVVIEPWQTQPNSTSFAEFRTRYEPYQKFWYDLTRELGLSTDNLVDNRRLDAAIQNFGIQLLKDYRPSNEFELDVEKERP